jgi:hypothetical protein
MRCHNTSTTVLVRLVVSLCSLRGITSADQAIAGCHTPHTVASPASGPSDGQISAVTNAQTPFQLQLERDNGGQQSDRK